jgi:hypothetical protein
VRSISIWKPPLCWSPDSLDELSKAVYLTIRGFHCSYGPARPDGNAMLAEAIAADSGRGGGAADPFAGLNIEFKEVCC